MRPAVIRPSPVGQQSPYFFPIGFCNDIRLPQRSLAFGGLFGQDMAATGFSINNFAGSGLFKALGSRTIGFNFRH
jgi:hypothetical protein